MGILVALLLLQNNTFSQTTVDLSTRITSTPPAGTVLEWHGALPPTAANKLTAAQIAAAPAGNYYAVYYDAANNCYSPSIRVKVVTNNCPATTVDLNANYSGAVPAGSTLVWYTNQTHSGTAYATPTAAGAGTYYAFFYDAVNNCYSPVSTPIVVGIGACPQPDVNAGLAGQPVPGNIATNDNVPAGTTYGTPVASGSNPSGATITMNADGTYTFNATQPGVYTYDVPVCAPGQVMPCPTVPLVITVANPAANNNPPVVNTDVSTTAYNTAVTVPILANDGIGNTGGTLGTPTITGGTNAGATATINGSGELVYTPAPGFVGKDTIYYQVCESPSGVCVTSSVIITVDPPAAVNSTVAGDDYASTTGTTPATGNLKTNDSDPQGNSQTVTAQGSAGSPISIPGKGTYYINSDGTYSFTPVAGFSGTVDIPYTTCDNGTPQACTQASLHIVVRSTSTLPIKLLSFSGSSTNCKAVLKWETAAEINADYIEVEMRAGNGNSFTSIGKVLAQGSNSSYTFTNNTLQSAVTYYRLKLVDKDGKYEYSNIIVLRCNGINAATIYPNPVKDKLYISGLNRGVNSINLYTIQGSLVRTVQLSTATGYVAMEDLPAGTYVLGITDNTGSIQHFKVVKN
jgi:hypothetical protein